ncbi:hypothetical protein MUK42_33792 [Musa troglodytarum]|uniref:Uncharacterized protein n=1 Tax=Musa troglodytarum TaxID=320322 RepID=A0A9E7ECB5_9LILI|nr:hypothetical protein MUK42_33792 [Musa troglodytarum]
MEDGPVLLHLLKLRPATSGETLADVVETLWKNRRTGLDSLEKSRIRSLLVLPTAQDLDPVSHLCPASIGSFLPQNLGSLFILMLPLRVAAFLLQEKFAFLNISNVCIKATGNGVSTTRIC